MRPLHTLLAAALVAAACSDSNPADPGTPIQGLYVSNYANSSITIYPTDATGDVAPLGRIAGANTRLAEPGGLALDAAGNLYVANYGDASITVYRAGDTGNVAPIRTITGAATQLNGPWGIVLTATELYVGNYNDESVTVYPAGANGNAAPTRRIAGSATGISLPWGLALSAAGALYVANSDDRTITAYAAGATGTAAPIDTIAGSHFDQFFGSILFAPSGELYVGYFSDTVKVFAAAVRNAVPTRVIAGANTGINNTWGMWLDTAGQLYVGNIGTASITVYAPGATGDAAPLRTIAGGNTGLDEPAFLIIR